MSEQIFKSFGASQPAPVKVQVFPVARNQITLRVENIADLFDYPTGTRLQDTAVYADIPQLAKDLYFKANGAGAYLNAVNIYETQLTGIESYTDMVKSKLKWQGVDDGQITEPVIPKDLPNYVVSLSAQRIRHFTVQYIPVPSQTSSSTTQEIKQVEVTI